ALVEDRRLGGVQVFRPLVVVEQATSAEPDGLARDIPDRPDQPPAEPVVWPPLALPEQPGGEQLLIGEPLPAQVGAQCCERLERVPNTEELRRSGVEAALPEETPTGLGIRGSQLLNEVLLRGRVRRQQPCP